MRDKFLRVSKETYSLLLELKHKLEKEKGGMVPFDDVLKHVLEKAGYLEKDVEEALRAPS